MLIGAGAQVDAINRSGQSPLSKIIEHYKPDSPDSVEIALYFLMNHTDKVIHSINKATQLNQCLLWILEEADYDCKEKVKIAEKFVNKGADVNTMVNSSIPIISYLLRNGGPYEALWLLKQDGICISGLDQDQIDFLVSSMFYHNDEEVSRYSDIQIWSQKLLQSGFGQNLLIAAAKQEKKETLVAILSFTNGEINLNLVDKQGYTALNYAIKQGNAEIFHELMKRNAYFNFEHAANAIFKGVSSSFDTNYLEMYKYLLSSEDFVVTLRAKIGKIKTGLLTIGKSFSPYGRLSFLDNTLSNYQDVQMINNLIDQQKLRFHSQFAEMQKLTAQLPMNQRIILYDLEHAVNVIFKEVSSSFNTNYLEIYKYLLSLEDFVSALRAKIDKIKEDLWVVGKTFSPYGRLSFLDNTLSNYQDDQMINNLIDQQKLRFHSQFTEMQTLEGQLSPNQQIILHKLSQVEKLSLLRKMQGLSRIHLNNLEKLMQMLLGRVETEKYKQVLYQLLPVQRLKLLLLPLPQQLTLIALLSKPSSKEQKTLLKFVSSFSPQNLVKFLKQKQKELNQQVRTKSEQKILINAMR